MHNGLTTARTKCETENIKNNPPNQKLLQRKVSSKKIRGGGKIIRRSTKSARLSKAVLNKPLQPPTPIFFHKKEKKRKEKLSSKEGNEGTSR